MTRSVSERFQSFLPGASGLLLLGAALAPSALAAGCSSEPPPVARVYLNATVSPGTHGSSGCRLAPGTWLAIGSSTEPVSNGGSQSGLPVNVTCKVAPEGDGFAVTVKATVGATAESLDALTIDGTFRSDGTQSDISAQFTKADTGNLFQNNCTVTYGPNMGVAAGRVWGILTCPDAAQSDQGRVCQGTAEFKFENCLSK